MFLQVIQFYKTNQLCCQTQIQNSIVAWETFWETKGRNLLIFLALISHFPSFQLKQNKRTTELQLHTENVKFYKDAKGSKIKVWNDYFSEWLLMLTENVLLFNWNILPCLFQQKHIPLHCYLWVLYCHILSLKWMNDLKNSKTKLFVFFPIK